MSLGTLRPSARWARILVDLLDVTLMYDDGGKSEGQTDSLTDRQPRTAFYMLRWLPCHGQSHVCGQGQGQGQGQGV